MTKLQEHKILDLDRLTVVADTRSLIISIKRDCEEILKRISECKSPSRQLVYQEVMTKKALANIKKLTHGFGFNEKKN